MRMTAPRKLPLAALLFAAAIAAMSATGAHAANPGHGRGGERPLAERALSLDEAVAQAERRYRARVVRAEEKRRGERVEYRIRLLGDDGRVFEVRIDAATGRES
jgi:uncharacterized membrane protein YkoI